MGCRGNYDNCRKLQPTTQLVINHDGGIDMRADLLSYSIDHSDTHAVPARNIHIIPGVDCCSIAAL